MAQRQPTKLKKRGRKIARDVEKRELHREQQAECRHAWRRMLGSNIRQCPNCEKISDRSETMSSRIYKGRKSFVARLKNAKRVDHELRLQLMASTAANFILRGMVEEGEVRARLPLVELTGQAMREFVARRQK